MRSARQRIRVRATQKSDFVNVVVHILSFALTGGGPSNDGRVAPTFHPSSCAMTGTTPLTVRHLRRRKRGRRYPVQRWVPGKGRMPARCKSGPWAAGSLVVFLLIPRDAEAVVLNVAVVVVVDQPGSVLLSC